MPVTDLPIFSTYSVQRFSQFGSSDLANWYPIAVENTKKGQALYPAMGRKRITSLGINELVFTQEPSQIFKSINYIYLVVGTQIIQVDKNFNQLVLGNVQLGATVWFAYLVVGKLVYVIRKSDYKVLPAKYMVWYDKDAFVWDSWGKKCDCCEEYRMSNMDIKNVIYWILRADLVEVVW